ncbi:uncharacterized protein VP01_577g4 [Puccinia sorghi]|uniref:Uncharacterized protein n=1 Tax=Puccinia sorghi TaxID=27349 RepID=A0A0L6UID7_9BASI|nr:uncharacterized protein VP01_577g4 [Puccinia sorghi]
MPAPAPASNPIVLAKPQPFDGTRGLLARMACMLSPTPSNSQTTPAKCHTWTRSETGNWCTMPRWPCGTSARLKPYTQDFNQHTRTIGWADTPLMSLYQHSLKENIQLAMVMSNIEFDSLRSMQALALKAGQTIERI